ncbi:FAD-dependent oxidoreductase [Calycomorphotria hydatis]|nr:FAD-dependent oxidoreductase [Calycomorphotria hydatis]
MPRTILLLGIGHTHAEIVRRWGKKPIHGCRLIAVTRFAESTYSGMLPAVLAGQFSSERMRIPLSPLCERAGVELIVDEVIGIDLERREVSFAGREPVRFDVLSVNVGSVPAGVPSEPDTQMLVPIKPMQTFIERLDERINAVQGPRVRIAIVGGGVAGVEIALCLRTRLRDFFAERLAEVQLITSDEMITPELIERSRKLIAQCLEDRNIEVITQTRINNMDDANADVVIWATGAAAPPVLEQFHLPKDERGFFLTRGTLQSIADDDIFAVGDAGTIEGINYAKAGVHAVKQAPVLWDNLQRMIAEKTLREYHPQSSFLKLLNTGDGKAIMEYGTFSTHARWCWWLKQAIDVSFVRKYQ